MPLMRSIHPKPHQAYSYPSLSLEPGTSTQNSAPRKTPKSHSRKREEGHIPRPRNAFIFFRSDFVKNGKIPISVENQSENLSRIAGRIWRSMQPVERRPWYERAQEEKTKHASLYPEYEYHPTDPFMLRNRRRVKKGRGEQQMDAASRKCAKVANLLNEGASGEELKRAVTELDTCPHMVVDDYSVSESTFDIDGTVSTSAERSIDPNFLDDIPIDKLSFASIFANPSLLSSSSQDSSSASSSSSCTLPPPSALVTAHPILPSKVPRPRFDFPGALHVPDRPHIGTTSALPSALPSKVRPFGGASSAFSIPTSISFSTLRSGGDLNRDSWSLRGPSRPSFGRATRDADSDRNSDYNSD